MNVKRGYVLIFRSEGSDCLRLDVCEEQLITTASGLIIAVIAVVFFNYFKSRIKNYNQEMIVAANQLAEMLHFHNTGSPIPTDLYQPPKAAK